MKPTIGRIVYFEDGIFGTLAAIITNIEDDKGRCTLALFHRQPPTQFDQLVVYTVANFSEKPAVGHWSWPPRV